MSIVIAGKQLEIAGLHTTSYLDDPKAVPRATDGSARSTWIRALTIHSTRGLPVHVAPGGRPSNRDQALARYQARTSRAVSWDATVDSDGSIAWSNDPASRYTWHAGHVNGCTVGIEMVQEEDGTIWQATIDATVHLIDVLTEKLGIQRQIPWRNGNPFAGRIPRLDPGQNGREYVGVYGHRNVYGRGAQGEPIAMRGHGDPGDQIFEALKNAGYEGFDPLPGHDGERPEDIRVWRERQENFLGFIGAQIDGIPGAETRRWLRLRGYADGLFVQRP